MELQERQHEERMEELRRRIKEVRDQPVQEIPLVELKLPEPLGDLKKSKVIQLQPKDLEVSDLEQSVMQIEENKLKIQMLLARIRAYSLLTGFTAAPVENQEQYDQYMIKLNQIQQRYSLEKNDQFVFSIGDWDDEDSYIGKLQLLGDDKYKITCLRAPKGQAQVD